MFRVCPMYSIIQIIGFKVLHFEQCLATSCHKGPLKSFHRTSQDCKFEKRNIINAKIMKNTINKTLSTCIIHKFFREKG